MTHTLTILAAAAAMILMSACDTLMVAQYRVASLATAKEEGVKSLECLARVASHLGLTDVTSTSTVQSLRFNSLAKKPKSSPAPRL